MRSTDYISKGTAVARLYKAREYLLMDKDCRKGLCFYLRSVDILDYLEEIGIWNLDTFSIEVLWAYEDFINRSCIVAMGNVKVVERKLNTMYSWKGCIDRYFLDMEVKAWWLINLQRWYVFFYEKNGRRVRGVLGKDRTKDLLRSIL